MSTLVTNIIKNTAGSNVLDMSKLSSTGRYKRNIYLQVDTTNYSVSTTWTLGPTFPVISEFQANSLIKLTYCIPTRNDSTSWGGGYIEPQVNFNGGTWQSLGSCGYDGGVMMLGNLAIGTYRQTLIIDPGLSSTFSTQFRFYWRSYDGSFGINNGTLGHNINTISGTAALALDTNGQQHFMHLIIEELARYS